MLWAFLPIAVLVTVTPGAATAMVVHSALRGGVKAGVHTIAGNSIGVVTSLATPKLAVFFVALFPQFVGKSGNVLATTLLMAALIVALDWVWYGALAILASRAKAGFMRSRGGRWMERATGAVLIGLGLRVALSGDARL